MGQYYCAVTMNATGETTVYSLQSKSFRATKNYDYYNGIKLMEHSWIGNSFTDFFSKLIYKNPLCVCWLGDYANNDFAREQVMERNPDFRISRAQYTDFYNSIWGDDSNHEDFSLGKRHFNYRGKHLVNHTKKCYFSLAPFVNKKDSWIIYPVSLLTAIGNGQGGGDYWDKSPDAHLVGTWAFDIISIEDDIPDGYMQDDAPTFKEVY